MKEINPTKLDQELKSAGISVAGCNSNGVVWDTNNNEIQDREDVIEIINTHDPTHDPVESIEEMVDRKIAEALNRSP